MSPKYYKGYKIGSLEKGILKIILNIKDNELPNKYNESFSDILRTARQKSEYSNTTKRMMKKGLLKHINKNGKINIILTSKGKEIAKEYLLEDIKLTKRSIKWDNKWRIVMFDIPEKRKKIRNLIRFHLKKIGFIQIQGSVWIYPYPCEEVITIIKNNFKLEDEIIYVTVEPFEKDSRLKRIFKI
jgi:CRISPR-associated endonuclease Cas2